MSILKTENLKKYYGSGNTTVKALNGINLSIEDGEFVAIVGTSGSGKSTLLHMIGGLDYPTEGKVYVGDKDIFSLKEDALTIFRRRKIRSHDPLAESVAFVEDVDDEWARIDFGGGKIDIMDLDGEVVDMLHAFRIAELHQIVGGGNVGGAIKQTAQDHVLACCERKGISHIACFRRIVSNCERVGRERFGAPTAGTNAKIEELFKNLFFVTFPDQARCKKIGNTVLRNKRGNRHIGICCV